MVGWAGDILLKTSRRGYEVDDSGRVNEWPSYCHPLSSMFFPPSGPWGEREEEKTLLPSWGGAIARQVRPSILAKSLPSVGWNLPLPLLPPQS